jgi:hypothetical protein
MIVDHHFTRQYNPEDSSEHLTNIVETVYQAVKITSVEFRDNIFLRHLTTRIK